MSEWLSNIIEIELSDIGILLRLEYTPPEKGTWGYYGGSPSEDESYDIITCEDMTTGCKVGDGIKDFIGEHGRAQILDAIHTERRNYNG